jgi:hypothetical protein
VNLELEHRLAEGDVLHQALTKAEKVGLLRLWVRTFPELVGAARHRRVQEAVAVDVEADERYGKILPCDFFILADDESGMPSYACSSARPPRLADLVSDTFTKCEELVVIEADFRWSMVFVNHGPAEPGRYFQEGVP